MKITLGKILGLGVLGFGAYKLLTRSSAAAPVLPPATLPPMPAGSLPPAYTPPAAVITAPAATTLQPAQLQVGQKIAALTDTYAYGSPSFSSASMLTGYFPAGNYIGSITALGAGWVKILTYKAPFPENADGDPVNEFYVPRKAFKQVN